MAGAGRPGGGGYMVTVSSHFPPSKGAYYWPGLSKCALGRLASLLALPRGPPAGTGRLRPQAEAAVGAASIELEVEAPGGRLHPPPPASIRLRASGYFPAPR
jgi:hypothetical protein